MLEFAKMKEELEQARCPEHGKKPVIRLTESGFEFKEVCCDNFRKILDENLSETMVKNIGDINEELY